MFNWTWSLNENWRALIFKFKQSYASADLKFTHNFRTSWRQRIRFLSEKFLEPFFLKSGNCVAFIYKSLRFVHLRIFNIWTEKTETKKVRNVNTLLNTYETKVLSWFELKTNLLIQ